MEQLLAGGTSQTRTGCIVKLAFDFSGVSLHDSVHRHLFGTEEGHEMSCLICFYQVSLREPGASPGPSAMLMTIMVWVQTRTTQCFKLLRFRVLSPTVHTNPYRRSGRGRPTGKEKALFQIKLRSKRVALDLSPEHIDVLVAPWQLEVRESVMALSVHDFSPWPLPHLSRWTEEQGHHVHGKQNPEGPSPRPCTSTLGLTVPLSLQSWGRMMKIWSEA